MHARRLPPVIACKSCLTVSPSPAILLSPETPPVGRLRDKQQLGTRPEKLRIQRYYTIYKDHITLDDYEIKDGTSLDL